MDISGQTSLWKFLEEERRSIGVDPRTFSFGTNEADSQLTSQRTSCVSATSIQLLPTSPETPWTRSPLHTSPPDQPLVYHCLASLYRSEGTILSLTVTKDFIFTGSAGRRIHAWKQPDCMEMGTLKAKSGEVRAILASGKLLFTTHGDCRIRGWEIPSVENFKPKKIMSLPQRRSFFSYPKKNLPQHRSAISCLAYNNNEKLLYTGSWDQTVKVWNTSEKRIVDSFFAHDDRVHAIVINQQDGCVFTCSSDGTVKIWRRISKQSSHILTMTLKFQPSPVNALALSLSTNDCFLYSGSSDGLINFWGKERISGRYNHGGFLQGHHFAVLCLVTLENMILSGSEDSTIRIWRREVSNSYHSCLVVIDGHHGPVKCLAAAMERDEIVGELVVYSASQDQTLKVWKVKVFPAEKVKLVKSEGKDQQSESVECILSPVLSPTWVEKKIQVTDF